MECSLELPLVPAGPVNRWSLLIPSLPDCLFLAMLVWLFVTGSGWSVLLSDGDIGWHIRTGDYILGTHSIPKHDLFSFSKTGEPWFAWEWLADVCFAALHRHWGLKGVVLLTGVILSLSSMLLFRHMLWRGVNVFVAAGLTFLAAGASTVHYLARPHVFTFLLLTASLWLLEWDRRTPTRTVWLLVPLSALWANLHGGFLALLACLALTAAGSGRKQIGRYGILTAICSLATLLNPYGYRLHLHVLEYLRSGWILQAVDEFQSPKFRSESMFQFEVLLILGLGLTAVLIQKRRLDLVFLVVFWAQESLKSVRHVPIYAIVAAPILAGELTVIWNRWVWGKSKRTLAGAMRDLAADFSGRCRQISIWAPAACVLLFVTNSGLNWPHDFPKDKFPVLAAERNSALLREPAHRILTSDQWADYLLYHFYPAQKVFVDGRSDFYGPALGEEYLKLMGAGHGWARVFDRYGFDLALAPVDWPLTELLKRDPQWQIRYEDKQAVLLERVPPRTARLKVMAPSAE